MHGYDFQILNLTHWGQTTHICVSILTIIGSDNGLSPGRRQAIIWTIAGIFFIGPLGTHFSEILIGIQTFSFKKTHLKMSSAKWRPFVSASMCQMMKIGYYMRTSPILCLLMFSLSAASTSATIVLTMQKINGSWSSMRNDLYNLHIISAEKLLEMQICLYCIYSKFNTTTATFMALNHTNVKSPVDIFLQFVNSYLRK